MTELVVALLMIVHGEIKEARIQPSMSECLKGARTNADENRSIVNNSSRNGRVRIHRADFKISIVGDIT